MLLRAALFDPCCGFGPLDGAGGTCGDDANPAARCGYDPDLAAEDFAADDGLGFGEMGICLKGFPARTRGFWPHRRNLALAPKKKPAWSNTPKVFDHAGLLVNEPPGPAGLPLVSSSDDIESGFLAAKPQCVPAPLHSPHCADQDGKSKWLLPRLVTWTS